MFVGYIYLDDLTGYQENEIVTGGTSNATATIVRVIQRMVD